MPGKSASSRFNVNQECLQSWHNKMKDVHNVIKQLHYSYKIDGRSASGIRWNSLSKEMKAYLGYRAANLIGNGPMYWRRMHIGVGGMTAQNYDDNDCELQTLAYIWGKITN